MIFDRDSQLATIVADGYVTLQDKSRIRKLAFSDIACITPTDDGDAATYSLKANKSTIYRVFIKTKYGVVIEPDVDAKTYCERIAVLIDA